MIGRTRVRVADGVAVARCYRGTVCACGRTQRRLRVFSTPLHDATGARRPHRALRRALRAQFRAWRPERTCDWCARGATPPSTRRVRGPIGRLRQAGARVGRILREELDEPSPHDARVGRPAAHRR